MKKVQKLQKLETTSTSLTLFVKQKYHWGKKLIFKIFLKVIIA